ncbi:MAG: D-alanyl-D-alanine carboxypeptidase family protein [Culicoidibacterales bacterium]
MKKKKIKIRWNRITLMLLTIIFVVAAPIWLWNILAPKDDIPKSQTISTQPVEKKYETPVKDKAGVYRIDNTIIVNKKYNLPPEYNPGENQEAALQLKEMLNEMKRQNMQVLLEYAGYRSYEAQKQLYEKYVAEHGQEQADLFSARPGFSEHQTGLTFDIIDKSGELVEESNNDLAAKWIQLHAHEYGFIVRYKEEKTAITGYMREDWHVRYLGKELAKKVYESKKSLEEYYNIEGGNYK